MAVYGACVRCNAGIKSPVVKYLALSRTKDDAVKLPSPRQAWMIEMAREDDGSGAMAKHAINNAMQAEVVEQQQLEIGSRDPLECNSVEDVAGLLERIVGVPRNRCLVIHMAEQSDPPDNSAGWPVRTVETFQPTEFKAEATQQQAKAVFEVANRSTEHYSHGVLQLIRRQSAGVWFVSVFRDLAGKWWMVDAEHQAAWQADTPNMADANSYMSLPYAAMYLARAAVVWMSPTWEYPGLHNPSRATCYLNSTM